ncbi:acetylornithine deacetylase [Methylocella sp.]|uniref:acetylornithine deacetylase n=1 Tax=Methylocella sp. TaxID=1978226 RepID=UPI0037845303
MTAAQDAQAREDGARLEAAIEILTRLVSFDTESSKSNLALVNFVESLFDDYGVDYVKIPNAVGDKAALFATIGPKVDGGVLLSGHTDVVPVEGQSWTSNPFELRRERGRLYGRGATDMKGFDAICLAMIPEFQRAALRRPIHILLSYDEETTCRGALDAIRRLGEDLPRPDVVLVGEPTLMQVADAHKAIVTYRTTVHGREAHSSKPYLGANAVEAACDLVCELYRFNEALGRRGDPAGRFDPPCSTIEVGVIHGGTARNILAKQCAFDWEFRSLPDVPQRLALDHLEEYIARVALPRLRRNAEDASIETWAEVEVPGLAAEPGSAAETLALKLAQSNRTISVPYATEAGQFQAEGLPTVVCGPGSIDQAHQPDEFLEESQVAAAISFMRRLAKELG